MRPKNSMKSVSDHSMHPQIVSELRQTFLSQLPAFLAGQRWFGGKARQILCVDIIDAIPVGAGDPRTVVLMVTVQYREGAAETYSIPVVPGSQSGGSLSDAFSRREFLAELLDIIRQEREVPGENGRLQGFRGTSFSQLFASAESATPKRLTGEQSNSSVIYGDRLILKFFRRVEPGENPDLEIGRFLSDRARFPHIARIGGWLEYQPQHSRTATQAILQEFVPNQGDAWRYAVKILTAFYQRAGDAPDRVLSPSQEPSEFAEESMARLLAEVALLGKRTAELHLALASDSSDPAFAPEPFTKEFQNRLATSFAELTSGTLRLLRQRMASVPIDYKETAAEIAAGEQDIVRAIRSALSAPIRATRTRIHGDYHLGQVLYTGTDFVIIDFEGEPARPLAERRIKQSPLQDVAGMLRSFHYAAFALLLAPATESDMTHQHFVKLKHWAETWSQCATDRFLAQYYETSAEAHYLPANPREISKLLEIYLLAKAIYELGYELNNRPAWVGLPLQGIARLLSSTNEKG
jgi:trehalose synthase-fused probable maltokinase